jgi:NAD(P)-dependent dehydrogenase (short-subunit alcohol dehydrogenase family)
MSLAGRHAIITGGGTGVGRAVAHALSGAGAAVTIVGRREAPLAEAARGRSGIRYAVCDVTDAAAIKAMVAEAATASGPPSLLVANAGGAISKPFRSMSVADVEAMLAVNLLGTFNLWRAGLEHAIGSGHGRLIAIASMAGLKGYPYVAGYVAAKHAVVGLVRALALELARSPVTVNAICPGFTDTPMLEASIDTIVASTGRSREAASAALTAGNPQGRFIAPEEIAATVLWLASDAARSVTGQAIAISGGET